MKIWIYCCGQALAELNDRVLLLYELLASHQCQSWLFNVAKGQAGV